MAGKRAFRRVNPLALAVLVLLSERPMHPYQMSQTLKQRGKDSSIRLNFGSLYAVVESLEREGLIKAVGTEQDGNRPARTVYQVTEAGVTETRDWMRSWLGDLEKEYPRFMAALSMLPVFGPAESAQLLRRRLTALDGQLATLRAELAACTWLPELLLVEAKFELHQLESERAFVEDLATSIESETLGGIEGWRDMQELVAQYPVGQVPPEEIEKLSKRWEMSPPPN